MCRSVSGYAIQMANGVGLLRRLEPIVRQHELHPGAGRPEKIEFADLKHKPKREKFGVIKPLKGFDG